MEVYGIAGQIVIYSQKYISASYSAAVEHHLSAVRGSRQRFYRNMGVTGWEVCSYTDNSSAEVTRSFQVETCGISKPHPIEKMGKSTWKAKGRANAGAQSYKHFIVAKNRAE